MCAVVSSAFSTSTCGVSCVEPPLFPLCFAASISCAQTVETCGIAAIAQSANFERAVVGSILTAGKTVESEKSECSNSGYKLTGLTWWP